MSEIEKMRRYIERSKMDKDKYYLNFGEAYAMAKEEAGVTPRPLPDLSSLYR